VTTTGDPDARVTVRTVADGKACVPEPALPGIVATTGEPAKVVSVTKLPAGVLDSHDDDKPSVVVAEPDSPALPLTGAGTTTGEPDTTVRVKRLAEGFEPPVGVEDMPSVKVAMGGCVAGDEGTPAPPGRVTTTGEPETTESVMMVGLAPETTTGV